MPTKVHLVNAMVFPVVTYGCELDYEESWALKNWCFWIVVLEKTLKSPLDCKNIQPVHPKGNQSWIFIGRTDAEAETPKLWPPVAKNWLIGKDPDAGKDWKQEKGMTEDEVVGCHHWLDGHGFEQAPGVDDGQGSLVCCSPWGRKESDTTEQLNWIELSYTIIQSCLRFLEQRVELKKLDRGAFWCEIVTIQRFTVLFFFFDLISFSISGWIYWWALWGYFCKKKKKCVLRVHCCCWC